MHPFKKGTSHCNFYCYFHSDNISSDVQVWCICTPWWKQVMAMCSFFIKFLYEGMILCTVCSVSEYIKGENIMCFLRRMGFICCKCLIWRNGFVRDYCQYCLFMNQNLFSNRKQLEAEHLGQESAENFATSRYCLCRGSVYLGWNTGQLWKAKWRNKLPSMEQGQQSQHEGKCRICSSRIVPS